MKLATLAAAILATWSAAAAATEAPAARPSLRQMVAYLETRYEGEVVSIALDASGDKAPHYHADLYYPGAGTSRLDVDAATLEIAARERPSRGEGWTTIAGAAALATMHVKGDVVAIELDGTDARTAHYDIDVRMPNGALARLTFDPRTQAYGWRTPPVLLD